MSVLDWFGNIGKGIVKGIDWIGNNVVKPIAGIGKNIPIVGDVIRAVEPVGDFIGKGVGHLADRIDNKAVKRAAPTWEDAGNAYNSLKNIPGAVMQAKAGLGNAFKMAKVM